MRMSEEEKIEDRLKEKQKRKAFKEECAALRYDTRINGVRFWDVKGTGRIVKGKKIYKEKI